jgi:hypothetical protein
MYTVITSAAMRDALKGYSCNCPPFPDSCRRTFHTLDALAFFLSTLEYYFSDGSWNNEDRAVWKITPDNELDISAMVQLL